MRRLFILTLMFFTRCDGFLGRSPLSADNGVIFDLFCDDFDQNTNIWSHKEIIEEAFKKLFQKSSKRTEAASSSVHDASSLEEILVETLGTSADSTARFLSAVNDIIEAAIDVDGDELGKSPSYHFLNENFSDSQEMLGKRWALLIEAIRDEDYLTARGMLGTSLATIQDFYSNTNWVELGHERIMENLGLAGHPIGNIAKADRSTCRKCRDILEPKEVTEHCINLLEEIIKEKILTSTYLSGSTLDLKQINRTSGVYEGKCIRDRLIGGRNDIGKALPSSCFSQHFFLHEKAAQMALRATHHYLTLIRGAVGVKSFHRLLSISEESTYVLVLDVSSSMEEELRVVKEMFRKIAIKRQDVKQITYIVVPFADGAVQDVFKTTNPGEIFDFLSGLEFSSTYDGSELSMTALKSALQVAPPFSQVFLLTDTTAKDKSLRDSVQALAMLKKMKLTAILTLPLAEGGFRKGKEMTHLGGIHPDFNNRSHRHHHRSRNRRAASSYRMFRTLSLNTGSQLYESTPSELMDTLIALRKDDRNKVILLNDANIKRNEVVTFPVDASLSSLQIVLSGEIDAISIDNNQGVKLDLLRPDDQKRENFPQFSVTRTKYLTAINFNLNSTKTYVGFWKAEIESDGGASLLISATSPLQVMANFYRKDSASLQPSIRRIEGFPPIGSTDYVGIMMSGCHLRKEIRITEVSFRKASDPEKVLLTFDLPKRLSKLCASEFHLEMPEKYLLPRDDFVIFIKGADETGATFHRFNSHWYHFSDAQISFPLGRDIWANHGDTLTIPIEIKNTAQDSNLFSVSASDSMGHSVDLIPDMSFISIDQNETKSFILEMLIPYKSSLSSESSSIITVNALSRNTRSTAHATAPVKARSLLRDTVPPMLQVVKTTSCSGYLTKKKNLCEEKTWSTRIVITDVGLGIERIWTEPESEVPYFPDVKLTYDYTYRSDCCEPEVIVYAMDAASNTDSVEVIVGELSQKIGTGALVGVIIGGILFFLLLILCCVWLVRRRRKNTRDSITLTRRRSH